MSVAGTAAHGWTEDLIRREETLGTVGIIDGKPGRQTHGRTDYTLRIKVAPDAQPVAVAVPEAKSEDKPATYGLDQAKTYQRTATRLNVPFVIATNGHQWTLHDNRTATTTPLPRPMAEFPTPTDLWEAYEDAIGIDLTAPAARPLITHPLQGRRDRQALLPGRRDPSRLRKARPRRDPGAPQPGHRLRQDLHRGQPPAPDRGRRPARGSRVSAR